MDNKIELLRFAQGYAKDSSIEELGKTYSCLVKLLSEKAKKIKPSPKAR
jgi:hypothetical protein